ncbi:hypothetical protein [Leptolyngbya sp. FACHB-17]|nr:hypothetical protein [Leptolyngbya sp. FACHB-17]
MLGWMELYRADPTFLSGPKEDKRKLEPSFQAIRTALSAEFTEEKAAGLLSAEPSLASADGIILDDDQRAIGETMLTPTTKDTPPAVIGYGTFCVNLFRFAKKDDTTGIIRFGDQNFWIWNATRFIIDMGSVPATVDFRRKRLMKVLAELHKLNEVLEGEPIIPEQ